MLKRLKCNSPARRRVEASRAAARIIARSDVSEQGSVGVYKRVQEPQGGLPSSLPRVVEQRNYPSEHGAGAAGARHTRVREAVVNNHVVRSLIQHETIRSCQRIQIYTAVEACTDSYAHQQRSYCLANLR